MVLELCIIRSYLHIRIGRNNKKLYIIYILIYSYIFLIARKLDYH